MGVVDIVAVSIVGVSTVGLALLALVSIIGEGYRVVLRPILKKRRERRKFLESVLPSLSRRYRVRDSFLTLLLCADRGLAVRLPKDIRQMLWRRYLKDAATSPSPLKSVSVAFGYGVMKSSGLPVQLKLERHDSKLRLLVLYRCPLTGAISCVLNRSQSSAKNAISTYYAGYWMRLQNAKWEINFCRFRTNRETDSWTKTIECISGDSVRCAAIAEATKHLHKQ